MNEDELDKLLDEGQAKEKERQEQEAIRIKVIQRERKLEKAFQSINVGPDDFNQETGEYPEVDNWPFCPPPPANYWRWYAKLVIQVAKQIVEDDWKGNLEQLEFSETNAKIALGLLFHAFEGNVESLAKKIEKAIMRHEDGPDTKAWLVVRIVSNLIALSRKSVDDDQPDPVEIQVASHENPEEALEGTRMSTEEVMERMLRRMKRGDEFPSKRKLANEIGCSYYQVDQAIKKSPELQAWERTRKQKRSTKGMTDSVSESLKNKSETNPAKIVERKDEAEVALRKLIENAKEKNRARYLKIQAECNGDAELTLLRIAQDKDSRSYKIRDRG